MVLISRKEVDAIQIGCDVSVTVIRASNGEVLLGVEAPDGTRIRRAELAEPQATKPLKIARTSPLEEQELSLLLFPTDAERQLRKVTRRAGCQIAASTVSGGHQRVVKPLETTGSQA